MNPALKAIAKVHAALYQWSGGRIGSTMGGQDVLLLHHVGAKSGKKYTTPLGYVRDGNNYIVVAAAAGHPKHPGWYYNLRQNPHTTINVRGKQVRVAAEVAPQAQRDELWAKLSADFPQFIEFQKRASRVIPVIILHP